MSGLGLVNKNVVVLGLGLTGLSCVRFLLIKGANVVAMDSRKELDLALEIPFYLGEFKQSILAQADLVVVSPGIHLDHPALQLVREKGIQLIGDIELFAHFNHCPIIAITGSNGKSTVTHLVLEMAKAAGKQVLMGGNIGVPVLDLLEQPADLIVLELSSFQLDTTYSLAPLVATVLNVSEDHIDRHGSLANYQQAKLKIFQNSKYKVINRDDPLAFDTQHKADLSFGQSAALTGFSWNKLTENILLDGQAFIAANDCLLVGEHNMLNIQAAAALCQLAGIDSNSIKQGAKTFGGLPHRCQTVCEKNNVRWINDSKATNVGATLAAIQGLLTSCKGRLILIAGGEGKGADFSPLQACIEQFVSVLITLGKDGNKIAEFKSNSIQVSSLEEAIKAAAKVAQAKDIVLLSPACASLDMFKNYQERGDCFVSAIKEWVA